MKNTGTLKVTTPTDREIVLTRVFDAPRRLVFDAFSKPELLKRWFGPRGWSMVVCDVDLKVGGGFRFVLRGPDGRDMGMRGVYRELAPPERSVHMESFDDYPGESQVTAVFVERDGRTTVNGLKMYYEIHGTGRPLVLLHGAFGLATVYPTLAKNRQVIAVELQGHGHTADIDRPLTFEQLADDTAALLKHLKIERADFFGY